MNAVGGTGSDGNSRALQVSCRIASSFPSAENSATILLPPLLSCSVLFITCAVESPAPSKTGFPLMETVSAPRTSAAIVYSERSGELISPSHFALKAPAGRNGVTAAPAGTCSAIKRASRLSLLPPAVNVSVSPGRIFAGNSARGAGFTAVSECERAVSRSSAARMSGAFCMKAVFWTQCCIRIVNPRVNASGSIEKLIQGQRPGHKPAQGNALDSSSIIRRALVCRKAGFGSGL